MSKEKYQIPRKAEAICLTILLHDLKCYDDELSKKAEDIKGLVLKMRNTRNVFVTLFNLKDAMNSIRIQSLPEFSNSTRELRRDLELIVHIRNKGVGHLDRTLLERAAQWTPELFLTSSQGDNDYITFLSYKALLEAAINSYLNDEGEQKTFLTEIDFLYPPNAEQFFSFLSKTVKKSISWIESALEIIKSEILLHGHGKIPEMGAIAGKTNFNLKEESDFSFDENDLNARLAKAIEELRNMGVDEEALEMLKRKAFSPN